jgi:hypothetical protein
VNMPATAAAVLLLLVISTFGVASWYTRVDESPTASVSLPPVPAAPRLRVPELTSLVLRLDRHSITATAEPAADGGHYIIHAAAFRTSARAALVMTQLADAGYPAYYTALDLNGVPFWQVIVGAYDTVAAAQVDLDKIRAIPGYGDARIAPAR